MSFNIYENFYNRNESKIDETMQNMAQSMKTEEVFVSMVNMKSTIQLCKFSGEESKRCLNYKLPYCEWLFKVTRDKLTP